MSSDATPAPAPQAAASRSAQPPDAVQPPHPHRRTLWALMLGNLVIATGFMLPAGMLHIVADAFAVSVPRAGALMWAGGITLAVGAPLMAWLASPVDRRLLLAASLLVYVVGHAACALATDFDTLLALRLATLLGAAVYTPQAAAVVGLLLPPAQRPAAVTFVFLGWSVASTVGMPLGSWVGARLGWSLPFWGLSAAAAVVFALLAITVPRGLRAPPVSLGTWLRVARHRTLPVILSVTVIQMTGQFALYTYLAPDIQRRLSAGPEMLAVLLAWYGVFGFVGNLTASRMVGRVGIGRSVLVCLALIASGLACLALGPPVPAAYFASFLLWGLGGFAMQSLQQARLIGAGPEFAPATVALNSSALYVGQAIGGLAGAWAITAGWPDGLPWIGLAMVLAAMVVSRTADRRATTR
jgi:predicted MFS family arabinose efflux permease